MAKRHRRVPRRVWVALGVMGVWGVFTYFFPPAPRLAPLARMEVTPGATVVLVPHPDDEALAAGGLIRELEQRGVAPTVILVTGGDAFKQAAQTHLHKVNVSPAQMVDFGRIRLSESRSALGVLGLPPDRLIFLGFPDKGLNRLWTECWRPDQSCASVSTGAGRVPYAEAYKPGAPYAGQELESELVELLRKLKPTLVVYPHPNEAHVDHWGLSNFAQAALEDLRRTDPDWVPPQEWLYLVHRGDWPAPKGYRPTAGLLPPEKMSGGMTVWRQEPLTTDEVRLKDKAVRAYTSQIAVLRRYMESFVRTNELFGTIDRTYVPQPGQVVHSLAGATVPPWHDLTWVETVTDPRADTVAREMDRGADLLSVWTATDGNMLYLAAEMAAKPSRPAEAVFSVRAFRDDTGWGELGTVTVSPEGTPRIDAWPGAAGREAVAGAVQSNWVRLALPLDALGRPETAMVNVETHLNTILIDRSAWRPVSLDGR